MWDVDEVLDYAWVLVACQYGVPQGRYGHFSVFFTFWPIGGTVEQLVRWSLIECKTFSND